MSLSCVCQRVLPLAAKGDTNFFLVRELLGGFPAGNMVLVDPAGKVIGHLQIVLHLVSQDLAPDIRLSPEDPGPAHLEGVTFNVG